MVGYDPRENSARMLAYACVRACMHTFACGRHERYLGLDHRAHNTSAGATKIASSIRVAGCVWPNSRCRHLIIAANSRGDAGTDGGGHAATGFPTSEQCASSPARVGHAAMQGRQVPVVVGDVPVDHAGHHLGVGGLLLLAFIYACTCVLRVCHHSACWRRSLKASSLAGRGAALERASTL